jgi:hypothetical protein
VPEGGVSAAEVGKEIGEHRHRAQGDDASSPIPTWVSLTEALLLAVVAVLAAWSGYASAKWSTESRLLLASGSTARTESSKLTLEAMETRNFDAAAFDAWFTAYVADDAEAMAIAERRFRPEFDVAFQSWLATEPATNPDAPPGPTFMPEYEQPDLERAAELEQQADERYLEGSEAGTRADEYVRTTLYLASVLFLVGISGHFRMPLARYGLVAVGAAITLFAIVQLVGMPKPPG